MVLLSERERLIDFVEQDDIFFRQICSSLAFEWEKYLVSDYWKSWRKQIRQAQSEEDAEFLANKVLKIRSCILWNVSAYKKGICDTERLKKSIEIKEEELRNITREEWEFIEKIIKRTDRFLRGGLAAKNYYQAWSKEELIEEISRLKSEIESLKTMKIDSEFKKEKVKEFSQKLEQHLMNSQICLNSFRGVNNNKKPLSYFPVIGLIILLILFLAYKRKRK